MSGGVENRSSSGPLVLLLSSGQTLKVHGVELYPADDLARIAATRADAARNLGGVSTGIGFIGSPGWAIGAGAALGLLESMASEAAKKTGFRMLAQAEEMATALLARGLLFRVVEIDHIERPTPSAWTGNTFRPRSVYIGSMGRRQQKDFLHSNGLTDADIRNDHVEIPTKELYAHNGDEFVVVDTEFGPMHVRWSSVVGYVAPSRQPPPVPSG